MPADKVKIKITPQSQGSEIYVNDVKLEGVRAIKISAEVDECSRVDIQLIAAEVEIEGESFITATTDDPNQMKLDV